MPVTAVIDCPYCHTRKSGFTILKQYTREFRCIRQSSPSEFEFDDWLFASCGNCKKTVSLQCALTSKTNSPFVNQPLDSRHGGIETFGYELVDYFPQTVTIDEPEFVPDPVLGPYRQAISNITSENWDAAGTMARKSLDIATKQLVREKYSSDETKKNKYLEESLYRRIKSLKAEGDLTESLFSLADLIRDEGNDAAHDEEPYTEKRAREIANYARVMLTYIFTIPGMVEQVKAKEEEATPAEEAIAAEETE